MSGWITLLAALGGHSIGSLSFARIMMRLVAPGREYQKIRRDLPGAKMPLKGSRSAPTPFTSNWARATAVSRPSRMPARRRYRP
jgi:hypothetical protein